MSNRLLSQSSIWHIYVVIWLKQTLSLIGLVILMTWTATDIQAQVNNKANGENYKQKACASSKNNDEDCEIIIDRETPSTTLPIRVSRSTSITLKVRLRPLETVKINTRINDVEKPDPLSAFFTKELFMTLAKIVISTGIKQSGLDTIKCKTEFKDGILTPEEKLGCITLEQQERKEEFENVKKAVEAVAKAIKTLQSTSEKKVNEIICNEEEIASYIDGRAMDSKLVNDCTGVKKVFETSPTIKMPNILAFNNFDEKVKKFITDNKKDEALFTDNKKKELLSSLNEIQVNQDALGEALKIVQSSLTSLHKAAAIINEQKSCLIDQKACPDDQKELSRTGELYYVKTLSYRSSTDENSKATQSINWQDLITKTAIALPVDVNINWGTTRFEVSGGAIFSTLPARSFVRSPIIIAGKPSTDPSGKVFTQITETRNLPTVVPVAMVHFRFIEGASSMGRVAWLISGGVGVNTYSNSADFVAGTTLAFRKFMVTPLIHFGRDQRLTNGLVVGQPLGVSPPDLSTERFWVSRFGIAISVGTPIN